MEKVGVTLNWTDSQNRPYDGVAVVEYYFDRTRPDVPVIDNIELPAHAPRIDELYTQASDRFYKLTIK